MKKLAFLAVLILAFSVGAIAQSHILYTPYYDGLSVHTTGPVRAFQWNVTTHAMELADTNEAQTHSSTITGAGYGYNLKYKTFTVGSFKVGNNNGGELDVFDSTGAKWLKLKDSANRWVLNSTRKLSVSMKGTEALNVDTTGITTFDTSVKLPNIQAGTVGTDSLIGKRASDGALVRLPPSASIVSNSVTLVAGVATITDSRAGIASKAAAPGMKTPGGTLGAFYQYTFASGTITITARSGIGVTQTLDTSTLTVVWTP